MVWQKGQKWLLKASLDSVQALLRLKTTTTVYNTLPPTFKKDESRLKPTGGSSSTHWSLLLRGVAKQLKLKIDPKKQVFEN